MKIGNLQAEALTTLQRSPGLSWVSPVVFTSNSVAGYVKVGLSTHTNHGNQAAAAPTPAPDLTTTTVL